MTIKGIQIVNLAEFRRACKEATGQTPRVITLAIRDAGEPVLERVRQIAARKTGALGSGYAIRASGATGSIVNRTPYGAGAEWGRYGKWKGFQKYGPPGRFGWRALEEKQERVVDILEERLHEVASIMGWAT